MSVTSNVTDPYDFRAVVLYAGATDSMIPWDWISQSKGFGTFMTEHERVEMLLDAVNGERLLVKEWTRLCGAPLKGAIEVVPPTEGSSTWVWEEQRVPLIQQARDSLREALEGILREPEKAVPEITENVAKIVDGRVIRVTEISELGVPRDRMIAHSIGAALIFALTLVLDDGRPYRRLLRQCALPACGRFALGTPPKTRGMPSNFYCSDEHRRTHRRQQATERQAAYRAGLPVALMRLRKLRSKRKP